MLYPNCLVADPCPSHLDWMTRVKQLEDHFAFFFTLSSAAFLPLPSYFQVPPQMWHCLDTLALGPGWQRSTDSDVMLYLKAERMRTGWKGARCGLTSKPVSATAHDCHSWHSNLCHGQITAFILSVDIHVILKRFMERATTFQKILQYVFLWSSQMLSEFQYCLERLSVISRTKNEFSVRVMVLAFQSEPSTVVSWLEKIRLFFPPSAALKQQTW